MPQDSFLTVFTVQQPREAVYASIIDPQAWWSGEFEGDALQLGNTFVYRYKALHYSKQLVTELIPGKRVAWQVLESELSFLEDKTEWTGTTIVFDIADRGSDTEVRFTHVGLKPNVECYDTCSEAWTSLIQGSLRRFIETGDTEQIELAAPAV